MDKVYGEFFFNDFFKEHTGSDYNDKEYWKNFFSKIATEIIRKFNPRTVLDAGCAMGYLVEALREKGIEAYGVDISDYAISNVDEKIKPYCVVHSITEKLPDNFPTKYDLVITIEVLEHLFPDDGIKAIANLCQYSDTIIFTSTPSDIENITHVNVQQQEYWCKEFAKNGFFRDHVIPVDFICGHAMLFRRKSDFPNVIFDYEIHDRLENLKLKRLEADLQNKNCQLDEFEKVKEEKRLLSFENKKLSKKNSRLNKNIENLQKKVENLQKINRQVLSERNEILSSQYWRMTKPCRIITGKIKKTLQRFKLTRKIIKIVKLSLSKSGRQRLLSIIRNFLKIGNASKFCKLSKKERLEQESAKFDKDIKFSIVVPLYNTPIKFLQAMIESVQAQTYKNWELCLADGSDESHGNVEKCVGGYINKDRRIVYKKLAKNAGIAENTNAALDMASGEYICLLDHDDVLHPSALYENMRAICEHNADFIYSDEAPFVGNNIKNIVAYHFKPDFSIDYLRSINYICHFTVFSGALLEKTGKFSSEYNGSQDHDMILRLTEKAKKIYHIRKIMYFWRSHKGSVASGIEAKTYAIEAGKKAVHDSIVRSGYNCEVTSTEVCPTAYRIKYEIKIHPLVSIIIPNCDHKKDLKKCIESIISSTTYDNYEIVIVENNSKREKTFNYYDYLTSNYDNIKVLSYEIGEFNYSEINNWGVKNSNGEYLILLNNDTEIITPDWIQEMLMYAQREDVGAVGAMLYYPDDTIQHAGVILGIGGFAGHSHKGFSKSHPGYMFRISVSQNLSAVTGACMMLSRKVFDGVNGFDEEFKVAFNDVDLCMKIRKLGYLIVFTPFAELYHYESKSRGYEDTPEKIKRFNSEVKRFKEKWRDELKKGDPYYNPNLSLDYEDFRLK
ncbi:MAG: glycosyltransferase [Clostridia bacterium]|nr:glycosyltransferase [Clostridia bacterium]